MGWKERVCPLSQTSLRLRPAPSPLPRSERWQGEGAQELSPAPAVLPLSQTPRESWAELLQVPADQHGLPELQGAPVWFRGSAALPDTCSPFRHGTSVGSGREGDYWSGGEASVWGGHTVKTFLHLHTHSYANICTHLYVFVVISGTNPFWTNLARVGPSPRGWGVGCGCPGEWAVGALRGGLGLPGK